MTRPTILVVAPMPAAPAGAGNRRRLLATCRWLQRGGFAIDLAYYAHEDQIYRRFGSHPPTDWSGMAEMFQRVFLIEPRAPIPLRTPAEAFGIDDWCPDEVGDFVAWYAAAFPETRAVLVHYVFLSRALERAGPGMTRIIDTHDRFSGRRAQYRPFRAEPNFFHTDAAGEAMGLARADLVLAIQSREAEAFAALTDRRVRLLPPRFPARRAFTPPKRLARIGFLGHGNDPNLFSIERFARAWAEGWHPGLPELVIAGEICAALEGLSLPGLRRLGYVPDLAAFYADVDLVVAPMLMGSGLKMKVGEALSYGVPVVGTRIGFEGFAPRDPAHLCADATEVAARVRDLSGDVAGLAALTEACAGLFRAYDAGADAAEAALIAELGGCEGAPQDAPRPPPEPVERIVRVSDALVLTCERSLRSLPAEDDDLGRLVATERGGNGADAYTPLRRRWFARPRRSDDGPPEPDLRVGPVAAALSPEWVRDRRLPASVRTDLACAFADLTPDWTATARLVGAAGGRIEVVLDLPSFLARGRRPTAAFLIAADRGTASEWRVEAVTPLAVAASGPGAARDDLPPVPASLALTGPEAAVPAAGARLLLLADDLAGCATLSEAA